VETKCEEQLVVYFKKNEPFGFRKHR